MRKSLYYLFILLITLSLSGFAVREENPNQTEQKVIDYFLNKEYKGDKEIYTEVDLYPPYFKEGEAKTEDIFRYLRLLRNEIFARKGYVFKSEDLKGFFGKMDWYEPKTEEVELNEIEKENVSVIKDKEERYKSGESWKEEYKEIKYKPEEEGRLGNTDEKYMKKVIIEAEWGDGPGEFGIDLSSSPCGVPGGIAINENGDIYILDNANGRIQKYNKEGILDNIFKVRSYGLFFGVKNGIIYSGGTLRDTLSIIDTKTREEKFVKLYLPTTINWDKSVPSGYIKDGEFTILQGAPEANVEKKWKLSKIEKGTAIFVRVPDVIINTTERDITIVTKEGKDIVIKKGSKPYGIDNEGNYYYLERLPYTKMVKIIKISPKGELLSLIDLQVEGYLIGDYTPRNPIVTPYGDIYFLYPTGKIIVEDWKKKFIPGKVQVIKWELQR